MSPSKRVLPGVPIDVPEEGQPGNLTPSEAACAGSQLAAFGNTPPVFADYELLGLAGRGAFGSVWVARDRTGVLLAVKIVESAHLSGVDHGEREEHALTLVRQRVPRHPHLVSISHVSRQDGRLIYVMELADAAPGSPSPDQDGYQADTLAQRIAAYGRLPLPDALRIALDLLSALESLHDAGLVHRDVKPGNVIFVGGVAKLADVGLATLIQTQMSLAGTAGYVPLDGSTGPDADLYALGKLLYQSVTGLEPADFPALPAPLLTGPQTPTLRRLNAVLLHACAPTRRERFHDAGHLRKALRGVLSPRLIWTRWRVVAGVSACCALTLGIGLLATRRPSSITNAPPIPEAIRPATEDMPAELAKRADAVLTTLTDDPVDEAFIQAVRALPFEDQAKVVTAKMKKCNPLLTGQIKMSIRGGKIVAVAFSPYQVSDLSPLRVLPDLASLDCSSPTDHHWGRIADLSPLKGMKLTQLRLAWNKVTDLSPLRGMPLEILDCSANSIENLEPLRGLPLKVLLCHINPIKDLSPLADLSLTTLNCGANPIADWTPLARLPLKELFVNYTSFQDFSVLKTAKLEAVRCEHTGVTDLGPLANMPLVYLDCGDNKVTSLEPLRKTSLRFLGICRTEVSDLSPLAGLRLETIGLTGSKVKDLTPLKGMPIRLIDLDFDAKRDGPLLRTLASLEAINRRLKAEMLP